MSSIYEDRILDHWKSPRNFGELQNPDIKVKDWNPLCGDVIEIQLKLNDDGVIEDIRFRGEGCVISQASASILTEYVKGKKIDDVEKMQKEDIIRMLGVPISPARIKCAILSLTTLKLGLSEYRKYLSQR
ncbi:MAG: Fe-S cluster assembly sulfur transfer protein SufU [Candidatus Caldarchaeales archaeon]